MSGRADRQLGCLAIVLLTIHHGGERLLGEVQQLVEHYPLSCKFCKDSTRAETVEWFDGAPWSQSQPAVVLLQ
jgi:hypothetical protein